MNKATYALILALVGTIFIAEGEFMPSIIILSEKSIIITFFLRQKCFVTLITFKNNYFGSSNFNFCQVVVNACYKRNMSFQTSSTPYTSIL